MTERTLARQLEVDEDKRTHAYQDSLGYWTIGIGRLIDSRKSPEGGLSEDEIQYLLANDIKKAVGICRKLFPEFDTFNSSRQDALTNLAFNLGYDNLAKFTNTIACINRGDWSGAQANLAKSLWFKQVGKRAMRVITALGID